MSQLRLADHDIDPVSLGQHARELVRLRHEAAILRHVHGSHPELQGAARAAHIDALTTAGDEHAEHLRPYTVEYRWTLVSDPATGERYDVWRHHGNVQARRHHAEQPDDPE